MEIQPGDMLEVVENVSGSDVVPVITIGQKFVCNSIFKCPCGEVGIDIGLTKITSDTTKLILS